MGRTLARRANSPEEFPLLKSLGLMAVKIKGDGNCLFNSFSDQLHGDQSHARDIRATTVEYMRENPDEFKPFINVEVGGGQRRNPKRKNVGAYSAPFEYTPPTEEQINKAWEEHLERMSHGGTYGDNMEIRAFAKAFNVDVKIYNHGNSYYVKAEEHGTRPVVHIAYHTWEHYSSVRNIDGPLTGLPDVKVAPEPEAAIEAKSNQGRPIEEWMINSVTTSLPFFVDKETIRKTLSDNNADVDAVVSLLLDEPSSTPSSPGSYSSQSGSSSIERNANSDDEDEVWGPNKRQNRKIRALNRKEKVIEMEKAAQLPDMAAMKTLYI